LWLVIDKLPIKGSGMVSVNLAKKQAKDEPSATIVSGSENFIF
jgi:hypothetical protein